MDAPEIPEHFEDYEESELKGRIRYLSRQRVNVLPLLDVDTRNTSVIFEMAENDAPDDSESECEEPELDMTSVTNALSELGKKDILDLQKIRRLLKAVYVKTDGTQFTVAYQSTHRGASTWCEFELSEETQQYEAVPLQSPSTLFVLPDKVLDTIIRLALDD
ncbi:hypothetical protein J4E91_009239 [Alternaria rosae]|nr:hypothetical protein J4E91_009239 [Alternaria rosae]